MKKKLLAAILAGSTFLAQANDTIGSDTKEAAARQARHNEIAQHSTDLSDFLIKQCDQVSSQEYLFPAYMRLMSSVTNSPYSIKKGLKTNNYFETRNRDKNIIQYIFRVKKDEKANTPTLISHIECRQTGCKAILEQLFAPAARRYMTEKLDRKLDWYEIRDRFTRCEEAVWKKGSFEGNHEWRSYQCVTEIPSDLL